MIIPQIKSPKNLANPPDRQAGVKIGSRFDLIVATGSLQNIKLVRAVSEIRVSQEIAVAKVEHKSLLGEVLLAEDTTDNQILTDFASKLGYQVHNGNYSEATKLINEQRVTDEQIQKGASQATRRAV